MAIPQEYRDLMKTLVEETKKRRVRWHAYERGVVVWFGKQGVHLWSGTDEADDEFLGVALVEKDVTTKPRIEDRFFLERTVDTDQYFVMFESAERQAKGVDAKLEAIRAAILKRTSEGKPLGDSDGDIPF